ncbi:hypothetical protein ACHAC9_15335 [Massilia sp. CMS3.1]|uniref:hypothetical protein n=1 Tax=Massilia sp. CMS3.1 TaxID=3373083 RepID=UPI003EE542ED
MRGFIGHGVPTLIRRVLRASSATRIDEVLALALFQRHYRDTNGRYGDVYRRARGSRSLAASRLLARLRHQQVSGADRCLAGHPRAGALV